MKNLNLYECCIIIELDFKMLKKLWKSKYDGSSWVLMHQSYIFNLGGLMIIEMTIILVKSGSVIAEASV